MVSITKMYLLGYAMALLSCSSPSNHLNKAEAQTAAADSLPLSKTELTDVYVQAIADYIKAVDRDYTLRFDTLFFGKHVFGQADDFPDIELPQTIENTPIRLITPEEGAKKQQENNSSFYINLFGWVNRKSAEFVFVAFSNKYQHQFDYYLDYTFDVRVIKRGLKIFCTSGAECSEDKDSRV